jgi:A/G-specific adenine glycosylase
MAAGPSPTLPCPAEQLRRRLLRWYDTARRRLPWRALPGEAAEPWAVLLSEVMLQQTTVATVRGRYGDVLARFPDARAMAAAPLAEVLHAWQGLGYYRRARALHQLAHALVERHGGRLPQDAAALAALPGLGPYTVAAVRAIAFGAPVLPVDGNVARVLARLAEVTVPLPAALPALRRLADGLAGGERPGDLAQALIELGALVCRPREPACHACPWGEACLARANGTAAELPRQAPAKARPLRHAVAFVVERDDGALLFRERPPTGLLAGMIELPSTGWAAERRPSLAEALEEAPPASGWTLLPGSVRHVFTHLTLEMRVARGRAAGPSEGIWRPPQLLGELALPTLTRKLLRHAGALGLAASAEGADSSAVGVAMTGEATI